MPTWTIGDSDKGIHVVFKNYHVFFAAVFLSLLYLAALFYVLWRLPQEISEIETYVDQVCARHHGISARCRPSLWSQSASVFLKRFVKVLGPCSEKPKTGPILFAKLLSAIARRKGRS